MGWKATRRKWSFLVDIGLGLGEVKFEIGQTDGWEIATWQKTSSIDFLQPREANIR